MWSLKTQHRPVCTVSSVPYLGGIKWMPHNSPEDGLGGIFFCLPVWSHSQAAEHNLEVEMTMYMSTAR